MARVVSARRYAQAVLQIATERNEVEQWLADLEVLASATRNEDFVIFADSMRQLQNVYERVVWLAQQCYPDYSVDSSRMLEGPLVAMRVGDLFQQKAGIIRSLSYDWMFMGAGGKWEVTSGIRMPMGCQVTMSYQIIHDYMPTRDMDF